MTSYTRDGEPVDETWSLEQARDTVEARLKDPATVLRHGERAQLEAARSVIRSAERVRDGAPPPRRRARLRAVLPW